MCLAVYCRRERPAAWQQLLACECDSVTQCGSHAKRKAGRPPEGSRAPGAAAALPARACVAPRPTRKVIFCGMAGGITAARRASLLFHFGGDKRTTDQSGIADAAIVGKFRRAPSCSAYLVGCTCRRLVAPPRVNRYRQR